MNRTIENLLDPAAYPLETHAGRDIGAGHLRGWGLEYGGLYERVVADPIFRQAFDAAQSRGSLLLPHKLANIYLMLRYGMDRDTRDIFEFGSFSGGSAVFMGTILKLLRRKARVYAFDTFAGMPPTDAVRDMHQAGDFSETGYEGLLSFIKERGLADYVVTVKGRFDETLPGILQSKPTVGFVHVDCDIYDPIKYVVRECLPCLTNSAYIVFDDPLHGSCLGAFDAVQELMIRELDLTAEQVYPHLVFRYPALR